MIAAGLGKITSGSDAELDAEMLQQDRHEIRNHDNHQQRVAESCAAREIRGPIARIHVTDRDKEAGPENANNFRQNDAVVGTTMLR